MLHKLHPRDFDFPWDRTTTEQYSRRQRHVTSHSSVLFTANKVQSETFEFLLLSHTDGRLTNSDWFINSYRSTMVVYENLFLVQSEFFVQRTTKKFSRTTISVSLCLCRIWSFLKSKWPQTISKFKHKMAWERFSLCEQIFYWVFCKVQIKINYSPQNTKCLNDSLHNI